MGKNEGQMSWSVMWTLIVVLDVLDILHLYLEEWLCSLQQC